ncbi:MAG: hypothetical protein V4596_13070 [Bdellovibrionota bacterium]
MKILRIIFICFAVFIGILFLGNYIVGNSFEEKLELSITNKNNIPISVYIRTTDLDLDLTDERKIDELENIQPGDTRNASINMDGTAPEVCKAVIIKAESKTK